MTNKICLLVDCLGAGGAEKAAANISISLTNRGYLVCIVIMQNRVDYEFKGELFNFGLIKEQFNRINSFIKFKNYFKKNNYDYIIDFRLRTVYLKELLFSRVVFKNSKVIYTVHNHDLSYYFSFLKFPWFATLPHVKQKKFISVCIEIQNHLEQKLKIPSLVIYNYVSKDIFSFEDHLKSNENEYIIAVGRLTNVKQFDILIKSYSKSKLCENNIGLVILGDGIEKKSLEGLIYKLNLKNHIKLMPFKNNPYSLIKNAKALVLTSKDEGFPMVLLEALTLNTPVIAFNCKSGPKEIIYHNKNGLLVDDQNEQQLTLSLNKLILDESFYCEIKKNTRYKLEKFSEDKIIQEWINLLENNS
tara:strand:- start:7521 stop:8597 length:1077 start_codon:yes stop_codon:yes gene_type:complete